MPLCLVAYNKKQIPLHFVTLIGMPLKGAVGVRVREGTDIVDLELRHSELLELPSDEFAHINLTFRAIVQLEPPLDVPDHLLVGFTMLGVVPVVFKMRPRGNGTTVVHLGFLPELLGDFVHDGFHHATISLALLPSVDQLAVDERVAASMCHPHLVSPLHDDERAVGRRHGEPHVPC